MGAWYRVVNQPSFYGEVPPGRDFIVVDDVFTMGGTLAGIRGFIENQGSSVICMSSLAHRSGSHVRIALDNPILHALNSGFGDPLNQLLREELGYEANCLTLPEAERLLGCTSLDAVRASLHGARDSGNAR